jgi:hypothetical protein
LQIIKCIYKHARRTPESTAPQPRATPEALALDPTALALERANWAIERATALPEVWALVAEHGDGLVDAWRLMSVCRAARAGAKVAANPLCSAAEARGVRRALFGWAGERRVEARPGDDAVGAHACARDPT